MYNWDESVLFTESFFIFGPSGTGKTLYAAKQLLLIKQKLWVEKNYKKMAFITVTDLLKEFRKTYQKDSKLQESDILEKYRTCDYLILDDISVEKPSDWTYQMLYDIINYRYENFKFTIITSNLSLEMLADKWADDRIPRRIAAMCYLLELSEVKQKSKN